MERETWTFQEYHGARLTTKPAPKLVNVQTFWVWGRQHHVRARTPQPDSPPNPPPNWPMLRLSALDPQAQSDQCSLDGSSQAKSGRNIQVG